MYKPVSISQITGKTVRDATIDKNLILVFEDGTSAVVGAEMGCYDDGAEIVEQHWRDTCWSGRQFLIESGALTPEDITSEEKRRKEEQEDRERRQYEQLKKKFEGQ